MSAILPWVTAAVAVATAVIAGAFGVVQTRVTARATHDLELQKLETQQIQAELAKQNETQTQFRQQQALPFLEQLNIVIEQSYRLAHLPQQFLDLGAHVPQLRTYANQVEGEWLEAMRELSQRRTQMLVAISSTEATGVGTLMTDFTLDANKIISLRWKCLTERKYDPELTAAQGEFVRIGCLLLLRIKNAALAPYRPEEIATADQIDQLATLLAESLGRTSVVELPFGKTPSATWIAIWQVDTDPEVQKFIESMAHSTQAEFDEAVKGLAVELYNREDVVESGLVRIPRDKQLYCLTARFESVERRDGFMAAELPGYRRKFKSLWSIYRAPSEMTV